MNIIFIHLLDLAKYATCGDYFIANLKSVDHLLVFFLLFGLRPNQNQIENNKNKYKREKT